MQEAAEARAAATHESAVALDPRKSRQQLADPDLSLHARERHAGAGVNAGREREMPVRLAADVEPVRIRKLRRIAVRGADSDMDVTAGPNVDAAEARVARGTAVAELVRALHAQKFLDRGVDRVGMLAQIAHRIGMTDQEIDAVADEIGRGLVAGIEQKDAIVQELGRAQPLLRDV